MVAWHRVHTMSNIERRQALTAELKELEKASIALQRKIRGERRNPTPVEQAELDELIQRGYVAFAELKALGGQLN